MRIVPLSADADFPSATHALSVEADAVMIEAAVPTITTVSAPAGTVGTAYSTTLESAAGAITWSISAGTLPTGLSLNTSTGVIAGTPTTAGTSTFVVEAVNSIGDAERTLSIQVAALPAPPPASPWSRTARNVTNWVRIPRDN